MAINFLWDLAADRERKERAKRGANAMLEAQQMPAIPQGGISPEEFIGGESYQPAYQTNVGQANSYRGLLDAGYDDTQAKTMIGLLAPQQAQKPTTLQQQYDWFSQQKPEVQQQIMDFRKSGQPQTDIRMGSVPAGAVQTGKGKDSAIKYLPGSQPYVTAEQGVGNLEASITNIENLMSSIDQYGSEYYGAESGKQALMYGNALSAMAKLRDLGVLQKADIDMMQAQMTDPSSLAGLSTKKSTMKAQYQEVLKQLRDKYKAHLKSYESWGIKGNLDLNKDSPPIPPGWSVAP